MVKDSVKRVTVRSLLVLYSFFLFDYMLPVACTALAARLETLGS